MERKNPLNLADPQKQLERIENFILNKSRKINITTAVIGLSGGVDSSLTAVITKRAMAGDRTELIFMPENTTPKRDARDVKKLANKFDLSFRRVEIDDYLAPYTRDFSHPSKHTKANIKARIRMSILYALANEKNGLVIGTSNLSEWLLGYFTKYGDGAADIEPLLHLFKTEVKELARHLNLPKSILEKPPSAGLWDGQTDEEELGGSYEKLDSVLYCKRELDLSREETAKELEYGQDFVDHVYSLVKETKHKRLNPPYLDR